MTLYLTIILLLHCHCVHSQNLTFTNITSPRVIPDFTEYTIDQYLGCKITEYINESTADFFITQEHADYAAMYIRADAFNPTLHSVLPPYGNYTVSVGSYDKTFAADQVSSYDICTSPTNKNIILCYHRIGTHSLTYNACTFFNRISQSWTAIFDVSNGSSYEQYPPKVLCVSDAFIIIWGGIVHSSAENVSVNFQYTLLDLYGHIVKGHFGKTLIEFDANGFGPSFFTFERDGTVMLQYIQRNISNNQLVQANLSVSFLNYTSITDEVPIEYISSQTIIESINENIKTGYYSIYEAISVNLTEMCCMVLPYATVDTTSNDVHFWMKMVDNNGVQMFANESLVGDIEWDIRNGSWDYHLMELDAKDAKQRNNDTLDEYFIAVYSFWDAQALAAAFGVVYRLTYDVETGEYSLKEMNTVTLVEVVGSKAKTDCIRYFCMDYLVDQQFLMLGWNGCDHFYGQTWEVTFPYYPK